jgi:hypothetical protein
VSIGGRSTHLHTSVGPGQRAAVHAPRGSAPNDEVFDARRTHLGRALDEQVSRSSGSERTAGMYIGGGVILLILIILLVVFLVRR